jgi:hypothetical protein
VENQMPTKGENFYLVSLSKLLAYEEYYMTEELIARIIVCSVMMELKIVYRIFMLCWRRLGHWNDIMQSINVTDLVAACVFNVLQNLNLDNTSKFDCAMWSIWKQRNDIV